MMNDTPTVTTLASLLIDGHRLADIRRSVRGGERVRAHRGVYVDIGGSTDLDDRTRIAAAHAHLGPDSTAVLGSALRLHRIDGTHGHRPPEFALPPGLEKHQRDGLSLHFWQIDPGERIVVDGLPVTTVVRTLADAARLLPRMQAVACIDSAMSKGLLAPEHIDEVAELLHRRRNCVAGRRHLSEARFDAQSPLETRVRLRANDAGLRPDALQVPIHDEQGVLLGYGDLGYHLPTGAWLIVEADGRSVHEAPKAILHDRHRQNSFLAGAQAMIVRFTWEDAGSDSLIPRVLRPILNRAGWHPRRP